MSIKNNCLYEKNNNLYFLTNEKSVLLLNFDDYESLCNNIKENKIFSNIISKLDIDDIQIIKEQFLPLFNYIILNNISIYISDNCNGSLYVENKNLSNNKGEEFLHNILKFLTTFYTNIDIIYDESLSFCDDISEIKNIEYFLTYEKKSLKDIKETLKADLIENEFIKEKRLSENKRYILPIYIDEVALKNKNIDNWNDYIPSWCSIAYLNMLAKIHDYFLDYYKIRTPKGLIKDDIMISLIDTFDYAIMPYPKNIKKSIEVGKQIYGKCFFIDKPLEMEELNNDLIMILQSKDIFNVVPYILY
ncbi:hypothetical protein [Peptoanaerobacter stomatis]|uniref:hypothetical protein n=1 Tax=Peptoanaerobacter stomatis TaxID=796937 RepID=UPI003FA0F515